jgi:hypothetical protein
MYCYYALKFAKENQIPSIVNFPEGLEVVQSAYNMPTFRRSFSFGGFTICYPTLHIMELLGMQTKLN